MADNLLPMIQDRLRLKSEVERLTNQNEELLRERDKLLQICSFLQQKPPFIKQEEVWENQRRVPFTSHFTYEDLLPTERRMWSCKDGTPKTKNFVLEEGWNWIDPLHMHMNQPNIDPEGWQYAFNWDFSWSDHPTVNTHVRRRRWIRTKRTIFPYPEYDVVHDSHHHLSLSESCLSSDCQHSPSRSPSEKTCIAHSDSQQGLLKSDNTKEGLTKSDSKFNLTQKTLVKSDSKLILIQKTKVDNKETKEMEETNSDSSQKPESFSPKNEFSRRIELIRTENKVKLRRSESVSNSSRSPTLEKTKSFSKSEVKQEEMA